MFKRKDSKISFRLVKGKKALTQGKMRPRIKWKGDFTAEHSKNTKNNI